MSTNNHYGLEVLVNEHQYELRQNADYYRLLQEGRTQAVAGPSLARRITTAAANLHSAVGHLPCLFAYWRYRIAVRRGAVAVAQPCS